MIDFAKLSQRAEDAGIRVGVIGGLPTWEMLPNLTHQEAIDRIRQSFVMTIAPTGSACTCVHYGDLHLKFPDGSDKRTDIAIFCQRLSETETAVTGVPEAVSEVTKRKTWSWSRRFTWARASGKSSSLILTPKPFIILCRMASAIINRRTG